jgi:hypothetical protein
MANSNATLLKSGWILDIRVGLLGSFFSLGGSIR